MDFSTVVELLSFAVLEALPFAAAVVVTLFPERWTRLTRDCPNSSITVIADCCVYEKNTARGSRDASRECVRYGRCADSASDSSKAQAEGACCLLTVVSVRQAEYPAFTATSTFLSSFCRGRFKITLPD